MKCAKLVLHINALLMSVLLLRGTWGAETKGESRFKSSRQERQLPNLLDPFGLLGRAGTVMHNAVQGVGKTLEGGVQHIGQLVEEGASNIDSAFKSRMGQVQAGLEEAGKVASIVGEDVADSLSALVSNQLATHNEGDYDQYGQDALGDLNGSGHYGHSGDRWIGTNDMASQREGIVEGVLRMVGINPNQLGIMALNALIFLAELITSALLGDDINGMPQTRSEETSSFLSAVLNGNKNRAEVFLQEAQDPKLPQKIIERLVTSTGNNTACLQLLICKLSPVVWGMQKSLKEAVQARSMDPDIQNEGMFQGIYNSLPDLFEFVNFSRACEKQFPSCHLLNLSEFGL